MNVTEINITEKLEKPDRRVQRTRGLLCAAILALLAERTLESLRIEDITERANLRRATFYMHYKDKEELLVDALSAIFNDLVQQTEHTASGDGYGGKTRLDAYLVTFRHAETYHAVYKNLLSGHSGALITRHIRDYLATVIMRSGSVPEVEAQYIAGSEVALVCWWIEHDRPMAAERMAAEAHRLITEGIEGRGIQLD